MRAADKTVGITRTDLISVGVQFDVKGAERIIEQMIDVMSDWPGYAQQAGVPRDTVQHIARELEQRRSELSG